MYGIEIMIETMSEVARRKAAESLIGCDLTPTHPSFFIEWDKDAGQFKMVPKNDVPDPKSTTPQ